MKYLSDLGALTLALDVTATEVEIQKLVAVAIKIYGHVDILPNNAGQLLERAVEEIRFVSAININRKWFTQMLIFSA